MNGCVKIFLKELFKKALYLSKDILFTNTSARTYYICFRISIRIEHSNFFAFNLDFSSVVAFFSRYPKFSYNNTTMLPKDIY